MSRTPDEIIDGWKAVASSAARPTEPPRPTRTRTAMPAGLLAAGATAVVLLVVLSARGAGPGPQGSPLAVGAGSTSGPAATVSPPAEGTPDGSAPPTAVATRSAEPDQTPSPADFAAAKAAVEAYTADLVQGDYAKAWAMLAPESQAHWQSLAAFTNERATFLKTVTAGYTVSADSPTTSGQPIPSFEYAAYGAVIDLHHAVLIGVSYPDSPSAHTGRVDAYIVSPVAGKLELFDAP